MAFAEASSGRWLHGQVNASKNQELHRLIFFRVSGDDNSQPDEAVEAVVPNVPDILHDLVPTKEMPNPAEVCVINNPYTGQANRSTVLHVVLQVHFLGRDLPKEFVNCIGQRFSEDPRSPQPYSTVLVPRYQRHDQSPMDQLSTLPQDNPTVINTTTLPAGYLSPRLRSTSSADNAQLTPTTPFQLNMVKPPPPSVFSFRPANAVHNTAQGLESPHDGDVRAANARASSGNGGVYARHPQLTSICD